MSKEKKLVLASVSPRRKELMAMGGWQFEVLPAGIDEDLHPDEKPQPYVLRMAKSKACAVAGLAPRDSLIVGADTTVVDPQGEILAKPQDEKEAVEMLRRLRGRVHQVLTGVVVLQAGRNTIDQDMCVTEVYMRSYSETEMHDYIATGDPYDKAGGYAIQHEEFNPVERIKGCYANVVGLPVCTLARLLEKQGVKSPYLLPADSSTNQYNQCPVCRQLTHLKRNL
ncbi:MAG: Maf family protein [Anaerolineales bacterium]